MAIPGYANKRLISFRRARMKQAGEHVTTGNPYFPSQQQDIVSAKHFVEDLTGPEAAAKAQRAADQARAQHANLMAGQALASSQGLVKCQTTVYKAFLPTAGVQSIVPQNFNRVFLFFSLINIPAPNVDTYAIFSFGPPQVNGGHGGIALYSLLNSAGTEVTRFMPNYVLNSTVIPTDEIFISTSAVNTGVAVFEGTPIA